ncbi:hypothetical protein P5673_027048 [Acropora cervicornis]|uniref:Uncharacterized protein n=1 Tax=Acropora cervicornis TaxID=6130 RepID=A0AAD9PZS3_ACRCE|nr:hypothetical protein P5673_027048 [Acropora cervicornis]
MHQKKNDASRREDVNQQVKDMKSDFKATKVHQSKPSRKPGQHNSRHQQKNKASHNEGTPR